MRKFPGKAIFFESWFYLLKQHYQERAEKEGTSNQEAISQIAKGRGPKLCGVTTRRKISVAVEHVAGTQFLAFGVREYSDTPRVDTVLLVFKHRPGREKGAAV